MLSRRSLLRAIPALLAAPAIVRVASLMPISVLPKEYWGDLLTVEDVEQVQLTLSGELGEWQSVRFIAEEVLPLGKRQLSAYQFGDVLEMPGKVIYTATRYRPLPFALLP